MEVLDFMEMVLSKKILCYYAKKQIKSVVRTGVHYNIMISYPEFDYTLDYDWEEQGVRRIILNLTRFSSWSFAITTREVTTFFPYFAYDFDQQNQTITIYINGRDPKKEDIKYIDEEVRSIVSITELYQSLEQESAR